MRVLLTGTTQVNRSATSSGISHKGGSRTFDNCRYVGPEGVRTLIG
jgi:hypothetical protein